MSRTSTGLLDVDNDIDRGLAYSPAASLCMLKRFMSSTFRCRSEDKAFKHQRDNRHVSDMTEFLGSARRLVLFLTSSLKAPSQLVGDEILHTGRSCRAENDAD
jgi:hypothetical protein